MPALATIIWAAITFLIQEVLIKFVILASLFFLIVTLTPYIVSALGSSLSSSSLTSAFASIPPGVWFFLDFFALDVGLPLLISAHVTRFIIRRLPLVG